MSKANQQKPGKFPLFLHKNGQWVKKMKGKLRYFGTDKDAALKRYTSEREDILAGASRHPTTPDDTQNPTIAEVCNKFLTTKKLKLDAGELTQVSWRDYYIVCETLTERLGKETPVMNLNSGHFDGLRSYLAKNRGAHSLGNWIQKTRTIFKFAFENDMIDRPVKFGSEFKKPSRSTIRKARNKAPKKLFSADEVRTIIDAAKSPTVRAMILLGINAGYGQSDIGNLTLDAINFKKCWIDYPRPKTGVNRRCHLWPETVLALKEAIEDRPEPRDANDAGIAFLTKYGVRWVRTKEHVGRGGVYIDSVRLEFNKLITALKMKNGRGFYSLRHTHRTVADETKDQPACNYLMGHVDEHISDSYREGISDERLRAVTDYVRAWLWPDAAEKVRPKAK